MVQPTPQHMERRSRALWCGMLLCWQLVPCCLMQQLPAQHSLPHHAAAETAQPPVATQPLPASHAKAAAGAAQAHGDAMRLQSGGQQHNSQAASAAAPTADQHLRGPPHQQQQEPPTAASTQRRLHSAPHQHQRPQQQQKPLAMSDTLPDNRPLQLPMQDFSEAAAALDINQQHQQQQPQQPPRVVFHPGLASSEEEVAAAAAAVAAAVSGAQGSDHQATLEPAAAVAAAARTQPPPAAPAPAPATANAPGPSQQGAQVSGRARSKGDTSDSDDFMSEDDYSIAYAGAFGVRAAAQAAALADNMQDMGAGGGDAQLASTDDDTYHDDQAEAAAAGSSDSSAAADGSNSGAAVSGPRVLDAPVPKYPSMYAPLPMSPSSIVGAAARAAAREALEAALAADGPAQATTFEGIPGLGLEDKILLARLLGKVVAGDFDAPGRLDPASPEYWALLDKQLEGHPPLKHMFEPTWYKCGKLQPQQGAQPATSLEELEGQAQQHILDWLGISERQLPGPGEVSDYDELVALLASAGAGARLVSDPLPLIMTTSPPTDRNGIPLLIHVTLRDKGRLSRHHMVALASWAKANPDHTLLLYDDADLLAYMRVYAAGSVSLYQRLSSAVERSDLWRYSLMCATGGVYTDADTLCVRPIQEWGKEHGHDASVLLGVEDVFRRDPAAGAGSGWGVGAGRIGLQFQQWTLAGAPHHPVFCGMPDLIQQRLDAEEASGQGAGDPATPAAAGAGAGAGTGPDAHNWQILHRTGPHVWTDSVLQWVANASVGWHEALAPGGRLVNGSTRLLPAEVFGCPSHFFSPAADLSGVYAMHMFRGVWRKHFNDAAQAHFDGGSSSSSTISTV